MSNVMEYYERLGHCPSCKKAKALEIIKNKELNIYFVKKLSLEDFNFQCRIEQQLTQEEYDLLKAVLL